MATGFTVSSGIKTQKKFSNHETSVTTSIDKRPPSGIRVKRQSSSSSLEILESKIDNTVPLSRESSSSSLYHAGSSRSKKGQVPPRPDSSSSLGRTTPTTTKQISLQTVKRIADSGDCSLLDLDINNEDMEKNLNERLEKLSLGGRSSRNFLRSNSKSELNPPEDLLNGKKEAVEKEESSTSSESEDEDEEERKAPNELFMEFLTCVMDKDYTTAQKLCKMILIYEPENVEAKSFQKLIDEKILLDDISDASDDDGDDKESGNDSDSDDSDSDDSSCDDSSDSSDDDSTVHTTDSGVTSASISD
ncbi:dentin sialophosphoprotein [Patella vulgata]|uniref:dentin sialophosphoprotein n=1 Tax=Patella vulgata TaxID=6465 RepID=UPI0024A98C9C|nr:dentin sialophosphoprotein [Patella vulgata]